MKSIVKKSKPKSATYWRKKCVGKAKVEAKKRDKYICQKCGKPVSGFNAHGSHIYNEGTYTSMSADTDNILTMCYHCHIYWWHKSPIDASHWFHDKYPELAEELKIRARNNHVVNWKKRWEEMKSL